jgi:preprotein translocase subunit SecA
LGGNANYLAEDEVGVDADPDVLAASVTRFEETAPDRREEVLTAGGLHIIGTERHESRRIDNQLRGRSGRQGDPGSSRFYLSLEDDLLRIFGAERIQSMLERFNVPDDEPIMHKWVTKSIANAQRKVEARNFDIRKSLLDYDDVMNKQRDAIYSRRIEVIDSESMHDFIQEATEQVMEDLVNAYYVEAQQEDHWDVSGLEKSIYHASKQKIDLAGVPEELEALRDAASEKLFAIYLQKEEQIVSNMMTSAKYEALEAHELKKAEAEAQGEALGDLHIHEEKLREAKLEEWQNYERGRYLQVVDTLWTDHMQALKFLKEGINLYAYAQKDPKLIYKEEAFELFQQLFTHIWQRAVETVYQQEVQSEAEIQRHIQNRKDVLDNKLKQMRSSHASLTGSAGGGSGGESEKPVTFRREQPKVGRNDPCPCGSGKKYKKCCLNESMQASA